MARREDNTVLPGNGEKFATDFITDDGVAAQAKTLRVKLGSGVDGCYEDASNVTPMPVRDDEVIALLTQILLQINKLALYGAEIADEDLDMLDIDEIEV